MIVATADAERELEPDEPRDLAATLGFNRRGRGDPTLHTAEGPGGWRDVWRAPGPAPETLTVMPDGVEWRSIPDHDWRRAGVGPQRMATIRRVAAVNSSLERLSDGPVPALASGLRSIPGVGEWTVAEVLQRSHGHPDLLSVGDAHLPHVVGTWFTGDRTDDAGMLELLAPWAGDRQRVVRLISSSGVEAPRFGAKATIEDHRAR